MMAEDKKSCCCGGVLAIVIVVLTILTMTGTIEAGTTWVNIVVLIAAILIALGAFAGCCCSKFCKTEPQPEQPQQQQGE